MLAQVRPIPNTESMLYFVTRQALDRPIATFAARQPRAYQVAAPNGSIAEGADQTRKRNREAVRQLAGMARQKAMDREKPRLRPRAFVGLANPGIGPAQRLDDCSFRTPRSRAPAKSRCGSRCRYRRIRRQR